MYSSPESKPRFTNQPIRDPLVGRHGSSDARVFPFSDTWKISRLHADRCRLTGRKAKKARLADDSDNLFIVTSLSPVLVITNQEGSFHDIMGKGTLSKPSISSLQAETRRQRGFPETEASLHERGKASRGFKSKALLVGLLSRLGLRNPVTSEVDANDVVWLFDNTAYRRPQPAATATVALPSPLPRLARSLGRRETFPPSNDNDNGDGGDAWVAEFMVAVFEKEASSSVVDVIMDISRKVGLACDSQEMHTIEKRVAPFLMEVCPGRQLTVRHGCKELRLGPTASNGIAINCRAVEMDKDRSGPVRGEVIVPGGAGGALAMETFLAGPEGWGVISGKGESRVRISVWGYYAVLTQARERARAQTLTTPSKSRKPAILSVSCARLLSMRPRRWPACRSCTGNCATCLEQPPGRMAIATGTYRSSTCRRRRTTCTRFCGGFVMMPATRRASSCSATAAATGRRCQACFRH